METKEFLTQQLKLPFGRVSQAILEEETSALIL
jgi:hypothetical protein